MEKKDREHIRSNMTELIKCTDYQLLMQNCLLNGILTPVMKQAIEDIDPHTIQNLSPSEIQKKRHEKLLIKLTKRGPDAYMILKNILSNLNNETALQLLNEHSNNEASFISMHPARANSINGNFNNGNLNNGNLNHGNRIGTTMPSINEDTDGSACSKVSARLYAFLKEVLISTVELQTQLLISYLIVQLEAFVKFSL